MPKQTAAVPPVLHRAARVVPIGAPALENGGVLVQGGKILEVGPYTDLKAAAPAGVKLMDHGSAALLPALVNAHTHLELSGLAGKIPLPRQCFADWLKELLPHRPGLTPQARIEGIQTGKRLLEGSGTCLFGDISNGLFKEEELGNGFAERQSFLEVLGFNCQDLETALEHDLLKTLNEAAPKDASLSLAAHACYSTSGELIRAAKEWAKKRGRVFSIHVAEQIEEVEFLRDGSGFFRQLLENLGRWVPGWTPPGLSPLKYLEKLGVLDERTLLVHAVYMTDSDRQIAAERGCSLCFCPRSNKNINTGRADIKKALDLSIPVSLGTDSLASNTDLSLFNEASYVLENYPDIFPGDVLSMITSGGARALSQSRRFGTIEEGKQAALLAVELPGCVASSELAQTIIFQGKKGAWQWAACPTIG